MNIPQLPTDNLYKFLALVGVLVSLVGFIAPEIADFELARRETELVQNERVVVASGQRLLDKINEKKATRDVRFKQIEEVNVSIGKHGCIAPGGINLCDNGRLLRTEYFEDVKAIDDGFDQLVKWKADSAQLESSSQLLKYLREKNKRFRGIAEWAMWGGLALALGGFLSWYFLVQRLQDCELRRKAISNIQSTSPREEAPKG